ncbi:MAG: hypothetical protein VR69_04605 [Peptococcaceae bacterium BRH_c4b]|nr:MAG: hypothetical protein VR69_04605 [Peptococcaceae bacterium BRH_c4b]
MNSTAMELNGVCKKYPGFTLEIDNFSFSQGAIMGLLGPNGAGKSTMIKATMNLVRIDRGSITLLGRDYLREEIEIKKQVGYVPEECNLYEEAAAGWLGQFVSKYYKDWDHCFYHALLEKFGVDRNKKVKKLSKGGKMKLSLCLALAHRPRLLLLDEPTSGLDPVVRHDFLKELLEVIQDESRSVLFSSHIVSDIEKVADYVAFIKGGQIALCDEKENILDRWRRVSFRAKDSGALERLKEYLAYYKGEDQNYQGVSGDCGGDLQKTLTSLGAENVQLSPMSLEEIMIVISRGEV